MIKTVNLVIIGKVQGVYFRASARDMARQIGLTGWVQNTDAGDVEIIVTGEEQALDQFINWCRIGPPNARVDKVTVTDIAFSNFDKFEIRR